MKKEEKLEIIELLKSEVTEDLGVKILSEKFNCDIKYPFSWLEERCAKKNIYRDDIIGYFIFFKVQNWGFKFYFKTNEERIKLYRFFRDAGYKTFNGILFTTIPIPKHKLNSNSPIHALERISFPNSGNCYSNYLIQRE